VRGIWPTIATITGDGFERVPEEEIAERFRALLEHLTEVEEGAPPMASETDTGEVTP
jgi:hypothetical protein